MSDLSSRRIRCESARQCVICKETFTPEPNKGARKYCAGCVPTQTTGTNTFGQRVRKYGVGLKNVNQFLVLQEHKCGICDLIFEGPWDKKIHVDHDHVNGRVRGLLCMSCNMKLGIVEDVVFVSKAQTYLLLHSQRGLNE